MGSFANSLHVKSADARAVAGAVRELLAAEGWRETKGTLDARGGQHGAAQERGFQVSAPCDGWVSVLDSDMAGAYELVWQLAERLTAPAIFCYVNDSDSWGYLLANGQGLTSEFDSEEEAGDDEDEGELVDAGMALGQLNALMQDGSIMQRMQDMQAQMMAGAPEEIRQCEERVKSGRGSAADIQQYQAWAMQEMPKHMADMRSLLGGLFNPGAAAGGAAKRSAEKKLPARANKSSSPEWERRLAALRPLLAGGFSDEDVLEVCQRQAVFAEEVLEAFLGLLGISGFHAHLSYQYLYEAGPEELSAHGIQFVEHLQYARDGAR